VSSVETVCEDLREELAGAPVGLAADIAAHAGLAGDRILAVDADHVLERVCGTCQREDSIAVYIPKKRTPTKLVCRQLDKRCQEATDMNMILRP
jgi:hypothetical protein